MFLIVTIINISWIENENLQDGLLLDDEGVWPLTFQSYAAVPIRRWIQKYSTHSGACGAVLPIHVAVEFRSFQVSG